MELSCKNLSIFQKSERILQDVELSVNGGEILAVIGHEGSYLFSLKIFNLIFLFSLNLTVNWVHNRNINPYILLTS
jgi:ABC-type uncharacterized transport system YnjBCD ATPase subunit